MHAGTGTDWLVRVAPATTLQVVNYAPASENAIHQDDFAKLYGFTGGLVPGVGVYAQMTHPLALAAGAEWTDHGWLSAKFIKPVYDGEAVTVLCRPSGNNPGVIAVEVRNPRGELCAVGEAGPGAPAEPLPRAEDYPLLPLPPRDQRRQPAAADLPSGLVLGAVPVASDPQSREDPYFETLRDTLPLYRGPGGRLHPAFLPHIANRVVARNIAVGPWIHTESRVRHFAPLKASPVCGMRGRVKQSYSKRGHDYVQLDLAVFDPDGRAIASILHTAIVRPSLEPA